MTRILIVTEGAAIHNVTGIPEDVLIEVHDYDKHCDCEDCIHSQTEAEKYYGPRYHAYVFSEERDDQGEVAKGRDDRG